MLSPVPIHAAGGVFERELDGMQLADRLDHRRARPRASENDKLVDVLPTRRERTMRRDPVALRGSARG